jgi:TonB family protein
MRMGAWILALAVAGAAVSASAEKLDGNLPALRAAIDPAQGPPIAAPVFSSRAGDYVPERAERHGIGGVAVIKCALAISGKLSECSLIADGPLNQAFGEAALKMAQVGALKAKPPNAFADGDQVRVIVVFPKSH